MNDNAPRRQDYCNLQNNQRVHNETDNFYKAGQIILNMYKTSKKYNQYAFNLTDKTRTLINRLVPLCKTEYIFFDRALKDLTQFNYWTGMVKNGFQNITGLPTTVTTLCKCFQTDSMENGKFLNEDMEENACQMGISVARLRDTYTTGCKRKQSNTEGVVELTVAEPIAKPATEPESERPTKRTATKRAATKRPVKRTTKSPVKSPVEVTIETTVEPSVV